MTSVQKDRAASASLLQRVREMGRGGEERRREREREKGGE